MGWIWCICCEKFRRDFVQWTCALIAQVQPVLHQSSYSNKIVRNAPRHEFDVQRRGSKPLVAKNFWHNLVAWTCALVALVRPILHRSSCSNEPVWNNPKYEFGVQSGGSGAFVAKNADVTSLHELVHWCHEFDPFCTEVRAVTKRSETINNLSLGSNRVDRVRSLRKFRRYFVAGTCALLALVRPVLHWSSCSNEPVWNNPKHEFGVQLMRISPPTIHPHLH
jgi:hypothetical protein